MTSWIEANQLANLAAAQAHGDLDIDTSSPPIDVYQAIGDAGVVLMWRRLPSQFGAYLNEPGSRPGILVNNGLPPAAQRHTAAHELGHHRLGHASRADSELDPPEFGRKVWGPEEKAAEAFSAWFLMPRKAVAAALVMLGVERPRTPEDVYRLSLLLGTSYRSTVRHLPNLRLADRSRAREWAGVPPNRIKAKLDRAFAPPASRLPEVWLVDSGFAGLRLPVRQDDRLVIVIPDGVEPAVGCPPGHTVLPPAAGHSAVLLEVHGREGGRITVGSPIRWAFDIQVDGSPGGLARRWLP
ncbi:hypothetical protein Aple_060310 [Acrocarpospora pleiomorpha]|uniref:IrrE N-terminal-like domain-containing protein n=1 Tax=Acrocarpospora pleiomorpha TaxID=90975 RepID=A0A5M3XQ50_9ACTN|nr:ImmA/IrrE family metallo-endopeptidase [Acrocarpospora pleiomorpha]GES23132.1 hypothetical protein Aple_060310 [Acrocarpospora pleiomorpha]